MTSPTLIATLGLGFILGLKHALDADHIVAVSTIVSEHKSISKSSLIGTFWGLGHTVSLFLISESIVLHKVLRHQRKVLFLPSGKHIRLLKKKQIYSLL